MPETFPELKFRDFLEDKSPLLGEYSCCMTITNDEIAKRAFAIWEKEGRPDGREWEHWFQAEAELGQGQTKPQATENLSSRTAALQQGGNGGDHNHGLDSSAGANKRGKKPVSTKQPASV